MRYAHRPRPSYVIDVVYVLQFVSNNLSNSPVGAVRRLGQLGDAMSDRGFGNVEVYDWPMLSGILHLLLTEVDSRWTELLLGF